MAESTGQKISATQKQALVDNLRLEVTERARSLRSQYGVMASSLRSRVELRINRIPRALRTQVMSELVEQYSESLEVKRPRPVLPLADSASYSSSQNLLAKSYPQSSRKRSSDEMILGSDKENTNVELLPNPKRRKPVAGETYPSSSSTSKPTTTSSSTLARNPSKKVNPAQILSPKNHNSRTCPASPVRQLAGPPVPPKQRPGSPSKAEVSHPPARMPGKQTQAQQRTAIKSSASVRGKRTAAATTTTVASSRNREASDSSENSTTTVLTKQTTTTTTTTTKKKATGGIMGKMAGMAASAGRKKAGATTTTAAAGLSKTEGAGTVRRGLRARK